jgi:hypothetical protein
MYVGMENGDVYVRQNGNGLPIKAAPIDPGRIGNRISSTEVNGIQIHPVDGNFSIGVNIGEGVNHFENFDPSSIRGRASLQHRLNTFGFTDNANQSLYVDGVKGPKTDEALKKFKASMLTPTGLPADQNADVDEVTSAQLNGFGFLPDIVGSSPELQNQLTDNIESLAGRIGDYLNSGDLGESLPWIGSNPASSIGIGEPDGISVASASEIAKTLQDHLFEPLIDYLRFDESPSGDELLQFVRGREQSPALTGMTFSHNDSGT